MDHWTPPLPPNHNLNISHCHILKLVLSNYLLSIRKQGICYAHFRGRDGLQRGRLMKLKNRKTTIKRRGRKHRHRSGRGTKSHRKHRRSPPPTRIRIRKRQRIADPRIARALGFMRREGDSASEAAPLEKMKLETFLKGAGRFLYRSAPGKPWKARNDDQLRFLMPILTRQGPLDVIASKFA